MNKRAAENGIFCSFFLERKKRPCRMKKAEGKTYCPHHSHLGSEIDEQKGHRIPCPYDSSHFCYKTRLQKHLRICNAREKDKPEYFVHDINAGEASSYDAEKINLSDISDDDLLAFIKKINILFNENCISIIDSHSLHPLLELEMKKIDDGFNNFKNMKQQASLLSLLDSRGFLSNGSCFVEFGAGKGQLMYWIVQCVPEKEKCSFILVDRSAQRHKSDNKFKGTHVQIERIRMDIQHLYLGKLNSIKQNLNNVIGVSKHLCGCATDLALRCLTNTLKMEEGGNETHCRALGFVMALCCHHRCTWSSYIGKEFMKSRNISELEFKLMCCVASWATCGQRKSNHSGCRSKEEVHTLDTELDAMLQSEIPVQEEALLNRYNRLNLEHEEREEIGIRCKRLIDIGRVDYLRRNEYQVELVHYIDKVTSLENVALIGFCK